MPPASLQPSTLLTHLLLLTALSNGRRHDAPRPCKVVPGDADWPSQGAWARLDESLGGGLLQPAPAGAVCHPGRREYDTGRCAAVAAAWETHGFHADDPASVQWNQFTDDSCLPDGRYPCDGGGYPAFVVNASGVDDVRRGVDFARENDVRLIVKGTGHDFVGRSVAPNSLSIWTHHMKGIKYHEHSFRPRCCWGAILGNAVTAEVGVQMMELYEYLDAYGETVVGGTGMTVGIGGYLTGGGHSVLSSRNGLAADQVLEMEVVTPDGEHIIANRCQNKDVFWAMRGGGGSTFGVLTSVTMRTIPSPKILHMNFMLAVGAENPDASGIQALYLSHIPRLSDSGASGYTWLSKNRKEASSTDGQKMMGGVFGALVLQDTHDEEAMLALMEPLDLEAAMRFPDSGVIFRPKFEKYDSFLEWVSVYTDPSPAGADVWMGSRLFDGEALADRDGLVGAIERLGDAVGELMVLVIGGMGVWRAEWALPSLWLPKGLANYLVFWSTFAPLNDTDDAQAKALIESGLEILTEMAPGTGAYVNEAYVYQPDWQQAFWGENYERLLEIKRRVDPDDVFWCHPCVGNEGWEEVGRQLCRS